MSSVSRSGAARTHGIGLDDGLLEHQDTPIGVVLHVSTKDHVFVKVPSQDKESRQFYVADKAVHSVFAYSVSTWTMAVQKLHQPGDQTFVYPGLNCTSGQRSRTRKRTPNVAFNAGAFGSLSEVATLLFFRVWVVDDRLSQHQ